MKRFPSRSARRARKARAGKNFRLARFEQLEDRRVLAAPVLAPVVLASPDLLQGAPLPIPLQATDADGDTLTYTVTTSDPTRVEVLTTAAANRTLKIKMNGFGAGGADGEMWLQLFEDRAPATTAKIIALAQQGSYDGKTFHRIIEDFMIQGGGSGSGKNIDDEFHLDLQFTSERILAMAKGDDDTGDNQFFITDVPTRWLDFQHTIFGYLTAGDDVRKAIQALPGETQRIQFSGSPASGNWTISYSGSTTAGLAFNATAAQVQTALNSLDSIANAGGAVSVISGGAGIYNVTFGGGLNTTDVPAMTVNTAGLSPATTATVTELVKGYAPVMKTVTLQDDKQNDVVFLKLNSVPAGDTPITVTVSVTDGKTSPVVQTFQVTPKADTSNAPPFVVTPTDPIKTGLNTPVTYQMVGRDAENDPIIYGAALKTANSNIDVSVNQDLGKVTITPKNNVQGVFELVLKAGDSGGAQDTQSVPLCIGPGAPTGLILLNPAPNRDSNVTPADNSSSSKTLQYRMGGLQSGAQVTLYADGTEIARGTATGTTLDLSTNGQSKLTPGLHLITVKQTLLNQTVKVNNIDTTTNIPGVETAPAVNFVQTTTRGTMTPAIYDPRTSAFLVRNTNTTGVQEEVLAYGVVSSTAPWKPVIGDWNGDGVETIGLYNPTNAAFYLKDSNQTGYADRVYAFGPAGNNWTPIVGDWNGDGIDTWGLYDPAASIFYLRNTQSTGRAEVMFAYSQPGAGGQPIAGDWNGDKTDTVGLYNPSGEHFYLRNSNTSGVAEIDFVFASNAATSGTTALAGDWNADGKESVGVYDPANCTWRLKNDNTTSAAVTTVAYGNTSWGSVPVPVTGDWDGMTAGGSSSSSLMAADDNPSSLNEDLLALLATNRT